MQAFQNNDTRRQELLYHIGKLNAQNKLARKPSSTEGTMGLVSAMAEASCNPELKSPLESIQSYFGFPIVFTQMISMLWAYSASQLEAMNMIQFLLRHLKPGTDMHQLTRAWQVKLLSDPHRGIAQYLGIADRAHVLNICTFLNSEVEMTDQERKDLLKHYEAMSNHAHSPSGRAAILACKAAMTEPKDYPALAPGHFFLTYVVEVLLLNNVPVKNHRYRYANLASFRQEAEQYYQCRCLLWDIIDDNPKRATGKKLKYAGDADL